MRRVPVLVGVLALTLAGIAAAAPSVGAGAQQLTVPGSAGGPDNGGTAPVSTGIVLGAGKEVVVTATGTVYLQPGNGAPNGPNGGNPGNSSSNSLVPGSPYGCLAVRVGAGSWQCAGAGPVLLTGSGEVQFGVNDDFVGPGQGWDDNSGSFAVTIQVPRANVTIRKTVTGADPGVAFPVTVSCASTTPILSEVGAAADGEIVLVDGNDSGSATVEIPAGGSKNVDVWWPIDVEGPAVENVTCAVSEDVTALPAGVTCTPTIEPSDEVVLYDLNEQIDRSSASFVVANDCAATPVELRPTFTG